MKIAITALLWYARNKEWKIFQVKKVISTKLASFKPIWDAKSLKRDKNVTSNSKFYLSATLNKKQDKICYIKLQKRCFRLDVVFFVMLNSNNSKNPMIFKNEHV